MSKTGRSKLFTGAVLMELCCQIVVAQTASRGEGVLIAAVSADKDGQIHIKDSRGIETLPPQEKNQEGCRLPKIADDQRTVGWLVEFANCCTSYPIPLQLVIFRDGQVIRRIDSGPIWEWQFLKAGKQVAFWTGPTHGDYVPHFELHDARSGRLLAHWDGHIEEKHPAWVSGLKE
jgi:hypothetical protein